MVCYHPLKAWPIGRTNNNKPQYHITSYNIDHIEIDSNNKINNALDNKRSPYAMHVITEYKEIPCGHCIGCRLDYSRQWADRCLLEMKQHKESYFITLTYNDSHLHMNDYIIEDTGEVGQIATLHKRDWQLFMKRLRKDYKGNNKLRFFTAGEYGDQSLRPHIHSIIFGLHLNDLQFYKFNKLGHPMYISPFLDRVWSEPAIDLMTMKPCKKVRIPIGFVVVEKATWETCAYVARYVLKKQKGEDSSIYKQYNFEPPFSLMSRRPGIGRQVFDEKGISMFDTDCIFVGTPSGSKSIYPSRYYKKLFEAYDEEEFLRYKELKELHNRDITRIKNSLTSKTYLDMLVTEEYERKVACKSLKREL